MDTKINKSTNNGAKTILICLAFIACLGISAGVYFLLQNKNSEQTSSMTPPQSDKFDYSWAENNPYIAHGFGGILGETYTNSYEAFLLNYQLGHRVFEVDFSITEDGHPVLAHDEDHWRLKTKNTPETNFSYDIFQSSLIDSKFRPVTVEQLLKIVQKYPDIYIVTDTKYNDKINSDIVVQSIIDAANKIDPNLLDRFIIQIYNEEMLDWVMAQYEWKSIIYTLYNGANWTPENIKTFAEKTGVKMITIPNSWLNDSTAKLWTEAGIQIAVHTLNDVTSVKNYQNMGCSVIYTDFLIP